MYITFLKQEKYKDGEYMSSYQGTDCVCVYVCDGVVDTKRYHARVGLW